MELDLTLSRNSPDWILNVSDFAATDYHPQFVTCRLHVQPTTTVKVRQFPKTKDHDRFVTIELGTRAQVFLSYEQAAALWSALEFSAGVPVGTEPGHAQEVSVAEGSSSSFPTATAPAEPPYDQENER